MKEIKGEKLFKEIGMTILTEADIKNRTSINGSVKWPEDRGFKPRGISLQEAKDAMLKCSPKGKRVCKQCKRKLPLSCFNATDEAKKSNPGIEGYCSLCWACP
jgi:hypothetical protein